MLLEDIDRISTYSAAPENFGALSRIWIHVADYIFYDYYCYAKHTSLFPLSQHFEFNRKTKFDEFLYFCWSEMLFAYEHQLSNVYLQSYSLLLPVVWANKTNYCHLPKIPMYFQLIFDFLSIIHPDFFRRKH